MLCELGRRSQGICWVARDYSPNALMWVRGHAMAFSVKRRNNWVMAYISADRTYIYVTENKRIMLFWLTSKHDKPPASFPAHRINDGCMAGAPAGAKRSERVRQRVSRGGLKSHDENVRTYRPQNYIIDCDAIRAGAIAISSWWKRSTGFYYIWRHGIRFK